MKSYCSLILVAAMALFMFSCEKDGSGIEVEYVHTPREWEPDVDKSVLSETTSTTLRYSVPAGQAGVEWSIANCENSNVTIIQGCSPITNNLAHEIIVMVNFPINTSTEEAAFFFVELSYPNFPALQNIIKQLKQIEWEVVDGVFDIIYGLNNETEGEN